MGFHIEAYTPYTDANTDLRKEMETIGIPNNPWLTAISPQLRNKFELLKGVYRWLRVLRKQRPTVVYVSVAWPGRCIDALLACALLAVPVLMIHHLVPPQWQFGAQTQKLYAWMLQRHLMLATVSQSNAKILANSLNLDADKVTVIENGMRLSEAEGDAQQAKAFRRRHGIPTEAKIILCIGRICEQKGYDLVPPVAKHIVKEDKRYHFVWLGDGENRPELEASIIDYDLADKMHIAGWESNVASALHSSHLLLFPSRFEGLPLSILEAWACKLPIVAADSSGVRDLIEHCQNGLLFRNNDPCDMLETLRYALRNPEVMQSLAKQGRNDATRYSVDEMVNQTAKSLIKQIGK